MSAEEAAADRLVSLDPKTPAAYDPSFLHAADDDDDEDISDPACSKPVTRRQAQRLSVESDRDLARRLQKEEVRRSARHSPY